MADKTPGSTKNSSDRSANVSITVCCREGDTTSWNSVEIAMVPPGKRQVSMRLLHALSADSDPRAASTATSVEDPNSEYNEQSINEPASGSPRKHRRAAELANTTGKCLERVSTTRTAPRSASKIASVNARVAPLAKRTCSGDIAIQWSSGRTPAEIRSPSYTPFISPPHIPRSHYKGFPDTAKVMDRRRGKTGSGEISKNIELACAKCKRLLYDLQPYGNPIGSHRVGSHRGL